MRSPPESSETRLQLLARRLRYDVDAAIQRIVLVDQRKIRAPAAEQLRKHLAEVHPHLRERLGEELLRRLVDSRDHVEQLLARGGEIVVLRLEKTMTLLELVVFLHGIEIHRPHVVELARELADHRFELRGIDFCSRGRCPRLVWRVASYRAAGDSVPGSTVSSPAGVLRRFNCARSVF